MKSNFLLSRFDLKNRLAKLLNCRALLFLLGGFARKFLGCMVLCALAFFGSEVPLLGRSIFEGSLARFEPVLALTFQVLNCLA